MFSSLLLSFLIPSAFSDCVAPTPNRFYWVQNRANGLYLSSPAVNNALNFALPSTEDFKQQFSFENDTAGYYFIHPRARPSEVFITSNRQLTPGVFLHAWPPEPNTAVTHQRLETAAGGYCYVNIKGSDLYLQGNSQAHFVTQEMFTGGLNQQWALLEQLPIHPQNPAEARDTQCYETGAAKVCRYLF